MRMALLNEHGRLIARLRYLRTYMQEILKNIHLNRIDCIEDGLSRNGYCLYFHVHIPPSLSLPPFLYLSVPSFFCLVCLSVCMSVHLSIGTSVCVSACLSVRLSTCLSLSSVHLVVKRISSKQCHWFESHLSISFLLRIKTPQVSWFFVHFL